MTSLTLHAMDDELASALRRSAEEAGTSVNQMAKHLLATALGLVSPKKRVPPSFMKFVGTLSKQDAVDLHAFVDSASFSKVDAEDWK